MLISIFAVPTTYAQWVIFLFGHILDCKYGSHHHIFANTLNDLKTAWDRREGRAVLLTTDWPDTELSQFLTDAGPPFVAVMDEPLHTVLARSPYMGCIEAIRVTTGHLSTLSPAFQHPRLIKIDTRFLTQPFERLLHALSNELFGEVDPTLIETVMSKVAPDDPDTLVQDLVDRYHGFKRDIDVLIQNLTADQRAAAISVADSYGQVLRDGTLEKADWPLELFQFSTPGYNLVGRGRTIVSGPFLCLPVGKWRGTIQCETAENWSGNEIGAEIWFPPETLAAKGSLSLPQQGVFSFHLDFKVTNPASRVELSLYLLKGAIEGKLKIRSVSVERIEDRRDKSLAVLNSFG